MVRPRRNVNTINARGRWTDAAYWVAATMLDQGFTIQRIADDLNSTWGVVRDNLDKGPPSERPPKQRHVNKAVTRAIVARQKFALAIAKEAVNRVGPGNRVLTKRSFGCARTIAAEVVKRHPEIKKVSKRQTLRDLNAMGMKAKVRQKGPRRYVGDEAKRLLYARNHIVEAEDPSLRHIFCDEKWGNSDDNGYRHEFVLKGQEPSRKENEGSYAPKVHFWAMIAKDLKKLVLFPEGQTVDQHMYEALCLKPSLRHLQAHNRVFVQDGARTHTALAVQAFLYAHKVKFMHDWPPRSPDLNPIENLWALLVQKVNARLPSDVTELRKIIVEEWDAIPQSVVNRYVASYGSRLRECIRRKGKTIATNKLDQKRVY